MISWKCDTNNVKLHRKSFINTLELIAELIKLKLVFKPLRDLELNSVNNLLMKILFQTEHFQFNFKSY